MPSTLIGGCRGTGELREEKLYQIIVHRHEARLPTLDAELLILDDLEESKPRLASRLVDRLVIQWLPIDAPNYRDLR